MNIDSTLKNIRKSQKLTLRDVASETGLSLSFISDIERGRVMPSIETCQKLCACYGLSMSELFAKAENSTHTGTISLLPSEAIYGIFGWLTSREQKTTFSGFDDAGPAALAADDFIKANNLAEPRKDFWQRFVYPKNAPNTGCASHNGRRQIG